MSLTTTLKIQLTLDCMVYKRTWSATCEHLLNILTSPTNASISCISNSSLLSEITKYEDGFIIYNPLDKPESPTLSPDLFFPGKNAQPVVIIAAFL